MILTQYSKYEIETIKVLRQSHPDLFHLPAKQLCEMWANFSDKRASALFLIANEYWVAEFIEYLKENI